MSPQDLRAFVISLPRAEGRRRLMQAQLEQPGMPKYEMVDGVDGRRMTEAELAKAYDRERTIRDFGRDITPPEIGATLGHMAAQRRIVEENLPLGLILEDDALLGHQVLAVLERLLPMVELDKPQVILLNHVGRYSAWGRRRIDKHHSLFRPHIAWGGCAHLVTQPAARALLAYQTPIHLVADSFMHFHREGVIDLWGVVPYVVGNSPLAAASTVGGQALVPLSARKGWRRWVWKYLYLRFAFQLFVKPALRLRKQPSTW